MRRIVCLLTVLLLCVGLAMPVFAAEDDFVPSITYKPEPDIVPVDDDYIGIIRDERDEIIGYIEHGQAIAGVIYDPFREELYEVQRGQGALRTRLRVFFTK